MHVQARSEIHTSLTVQKPGETSRRRKGKVALVALAAVAAVMLPARASAQQTQLDLHGNLAIGTSSHTKSWGGGAGVQVTAGSQPVKVSLAPSVDYLKQENNGPSQTTLSADLDVQPGGDSPLTPCAGVSAGANRSGGNNKQWRGVALASRRSPACRRSPATRTSARR